MVTRYKVAFWHQSLVRSNTSAYVNFHKYRRLRKIMLEWSGPN